MRVCPEGAVRLGKTTGAGGGEGCGVGVALGVDTGGTFVQGLGRRRRSFGFGVNGQRTGFPLFFLERENLEKEKIVLPSRLDYLLWKRKGRCTHTLGLFVWALPLTWAAWLLLVQS